MGSSALLTTTTRLAACKPPRRPVSSLLTRWAADLSEPPRLLTGSGRSERASSPDLLRVQRARIGMENALRQVMSLLYTCMHRLPFCPLSGSGPPREALLSLHKPACGQATL